jgi:SAM-dependent methyltransferase
MEKKLQIGRDVIMHCLKYVNGETLDYGAGIGKYRNFIKPHTTSYLTFDQSADSGADIIGDVHSTSLPDDSFDTIFCTQVLEHVSEPREVLKQIHRVLRVDGMCIITAPFCIPYHADPKDYYRYSKEGLIHLTSDAGFSLIESGTYGGVFMVISEFIRFSFFNPYKKKQFRGAFRLMKDIQSVAGFLDRLSKNSIIYPNSYVVVKKNRRGLVSA